MIKKNIKPLILTIASGTLTGVSIYYTVFWLIWFALVPFLHLINISERWKRVKYGFIFSMMCGGVQLGWIIEGTMRYSGTETYLGIPLFFLAIIYYSIFTILFLVAIPTKKPVYTGFNILLIPIIWSISEWLRVTISEGLPWFKMTLATSQLNNLYGLQLSSITGQYGISLVIILINLLILKAICDKKRVHIITPIITLIIFYGGGYIFLYSENNETKNEYTIGLIQENIKAETKWDQSNGDSLATALFTISDEAKRGEAELIIWSESTLPWSYRKDDHLIANLLSITKNKYHLLGMLTETGKGNMVYNSAYYIDPQGVVEDRYDKRKLLSFIEKPLFNSSFKIPFITNSLYSNVVSGTKDHLINTTTGKAGVLICNESLSPSPASEIVNEGADYIVNMSNDAWLTGTELIEHHFYTNRLRAIEQRTPFIINSNKGYSGIIDHRGEVLRKSKSEKSQYIELQFSYSSEKSIYSNFGDWLIYLGIGITFLFYTIVSIKSKRISLN